MRSSITILALTILFAFSSCNTAKKMTVEGEGANYKNLKQLSVANEKFSPEFNWYVANGRIKYRSSSNNLSFNSNIAMRYDSVAFCRMTKLGFEVAKFMADDEKYTLLNKLERTYQQSSISEIYALTGTTDANFATFQKLFLGSAPSDFSWVKHLSYNDGIYTLKGLIKGTELIMMLRSSDLKIVELWANHSAENQKVHLVFDKYTKLDNQGNEAPATLKIELEGKENAIIDISFSKIELKLHETIEFEIPDDYKKAD